MMRSTVLRLAFVVVAISAFATACLGIYLSRTDLLFIATMLGVSVVGLMSFVALRRVGSLLASFESKSRNDLLIERDMLGKLVELKKQGRVEREKSLAWSSELQRLMLDSHDSIAEYTSETVDRLVSAQKTLDLALAGVGRLDALIQAIEARVAVAHSAIGSIESTIFLSDRKNQEALMAIRDSVDDNSTHVVSLLSCVAELERCSIAESECNRERTKLLDTKLDSLQSSVSAMTISNHSLIDRLDCAERTAEDSARLHIEAMQNIYGEIVSQATRLGKWTSDFELYVSDIVKTTVKDVVVEQGDDIRNVLHAEVAKPIKGIRRIIDNGELRFPLLNDISSVDRLVAQFKPSAPMPLMSGWALEPASIDRLVSQVVARKPHLLVECGSGATTLWLAYAMRQVGGRLVALEHLEKFADATRFDLERHGLQDVAEVRLAPLEEVTIHGVAYNWYALDSLKGIDGIEFLLVDGPPKSSGPEARYPAVPLLRHAFSASCLVVLDDIHRPEEKSILDRWKSEEPGSGKEFPIGNRTVGIDWARIAQKQRSGSRSSRRKSAAE